MDILEDADGVLFDLDGTLVSEGKPLPWAKELLAASGSHFAIVTNDAEHMPTQIARMLGRAGLAVPAERIVAAGAETLALVAQEMPGATVLLAASNALKMYAHHLGLAVRQDHVDAVVIGRDRGFSYRTLIAAANEVIAGARLFVANPDHVHPGRSGRVIPDTGALAGALLACTGPRPYRVVGKPESHLFEIGLDILGTEPARTVMVGDNPETDGAGARRLGLRYVPIDYAQPIRPGSLAIARRDERELAAGPLGTPVV